ncbi:MAG: TonB-dependent receptor plug domain-containing protein, partial [Bacteroidaceae bacterium]|nr:TonB-dependent receptor plug domain-containing protein [Bacteroidaceae bacterium]
MKQKLNLRFCMTLLIGIFVSVSAFAQNITVKGHVKDNLGEVNGATVLQKGTSNGCVTDLNGDFTLSVPRGATLVISFVGYVTQEVTAAPTLNIMLQEDSKLLSEQIVIGYGKVKKNDLTGSVIAMKPDEMNHGLQTNAQDMIQGKIAGVSVVPGDGTPGSSASIRIRGGSSLNASNDPLIVVDGLALDSYGANEGAANALAMINPADIESYTVLKDASAAAIYGSRASNGVIIITTKKGKVSSGPKVSYNGNVSFSVNTKRLEVMDS